jgi:phosphopentomutase
LDDISELDEFAYTSTKRDRNLKFGTGVKEEKEESCYFEVNSEENTGSQIHSQLGHSERLENEVGVGAQEEQVEEIGNQQNILDIDQVYEDESNDRMSNNEEFARSHLISYEQPLELPP